MTPRRVFVGTRAPGKVSRVSHDSSIPGSEYTSQVVELVEHLRATQGPFFVSRLIMRVPFSITSGDQHTDAENYKALRAICAEMGLDEDALTVRGITH